MKPIRFEQATGELGRPPSMSEAECQPLPVHANGEGFISCWQLSADELAEVSRTGRLWLGVCGRAHPPVWVAAFSPFPEAR